MIKSVNNYPVSQLFDIEAGVVYPLQPDGDLREAMTLFRLDVEES